MRVWPACWTWRYIGTEGKRRPSEDGVGCDGIMGANSCPGHVEPRSPHMVLTASGRNISLRDGSSAPANHHPTSASRRSRFCPSSHISPSHTSRLLAAMADRSAKRLRRLSTDYEDSSGADDWASQSRKDKGVSNPSRYVSPSLVSRWLQHAPSSRSRCPFQPRGRTSLANKRHTCSMQTSRARAAPHPSPLRRHISLRTSSPSAAS
jgi:hypothetical protein